jgi:hypothetical protein
VENSHRTDIINIRRKVCVQDQQGWLYACWPAAPRQRYYPEKDEQDGLHQYL